MIGRFCRLHPIAAALLLAVLLVLVVPSVALALTGAAPRGSSDLFSNIAPTPQVNGGLADLYPLSHYSLDYHETGVGVGLTSGIDVSGIPAVIENFIASMIWGFTAWLAKTLITAFTWAFSLDLVNGSQATNGAGALQPVSQAVQNIYNNTFGEPWAIVGILGAGLWAMKTALVDRRFTETAGALAKSLLFVVIALGIVISPDQTIGRATRATNEFSAAVLSLGKTGNPNDPQTAKRDASDQLFKLLVYDPWVVLNFGGVDHCVETSTIATSGALNKGSNAQNTEPVPMPVEPLTPAQQQQLASGQEIQAGNKTCINNENKYAPHFLYFADGAPDRDNTSSDGPQDTEILALNDPLNHHAPLSDPFRAGYQLTAADIPAADAMQNGGQLSRLLMSVIIFLGELGAFILLGALSLGVILAQVVLLLLFAFTPIALVAGIVPGRGHTLFTTWWMRMASFGLRKAFYSLVLAVLLAVNSALASASSDLGWFLSFGLQGAFFWSVFLYRHELVAQLSMAVAGVAGSHDGARRLQSLYYSGQMLRGPMRMAGRGTDAARDTAKASGRAVVATGRFAGRRAEEARGGMLELLERAGPTLPSPSEMMRNSQDDGSNGRTSHTGGGVVPPTAGGPGGRRDDGPSNNGGPSAGPSPTDGPSPRHDGGATPDLPLPPIERENGRHSEPQPTERPASPPDVPVPRSQRESSTDTRRRSQREPASLRDLSAPRGQPQRPDEPAEPPAPRSRQEVDGGPPGRGSSAAPRSDVSPLMRSLEEDEERFRRWRENRPPAREPQTPTPRARRGLRRPRRPRPDDDGGEQ